MKPSQRRIAPPAPQVEQCRHRYLLHLDGNAYSAGLKYKLACGALVFKAASNHSEFYERGLVTGVHYVEVPLEGSAAAGGSVTADDDATSSTFVRRLASLLRWYAATAEGRAEAGAHLSARCRGRRGLVEGHRNAFTGVDVKGVVRAIEQRSDPSASPSAGELPRDAGTRYRSCSCTVRTAYSHLAL